MLLKGQKMVITFEISGVPFGKQRPYVVRGRNGVHGIKRKESILHENLAREAWHQAINLKQEFDWDISLDLTAYYPIPKKSWPQWKQNAARFGYIRPNRKGPSKPDADNVAKWVMDSLNPNKIGHKAIPNSGIYADDGQVVHLSIDSYYSDDPRTVVRIEATPKPDMNEIKKKVKERLKQNDEI